MCAFERTIKKARRGSALASTEQSPREVGHVHVRVDAQGGEHLVQAFVGLGAVVPNLSVGDVGIPVGLFRSGNEATCSATDRNHIVSPVEEHQESLRHEPDVSVAGETVQQSRPDAV